MIKAIRVSPELSFDPARFCSVSLDPNPIKGKYWVALILKKGERHVMGFDNQKDAIDAITYITDEVNKAVSPIESMTDEILSPWRDVGAFGTPSKVEDLIKRTAREAAEAFWNTPIETTRSSDTLCEMVRNPDGTSGVAWSGEPGTPEGE